MKHRSRADAKVIGVHRKIGVVGSKRNTGRRQEPDLIENVYAMEDRFDFVIAIVTPAQNAQAQVDLCVRPDAHHDV